jgi:Family of unknown function (DUF5309)
MPKVYSNELVGKRESVVDELLTLNPHQTPMISLVGFGSSIGAVEHTWFEDEMFGDESVVAGAKLVADTTIVVADVEPFRVGHVVKIGEELLLVTAVNVGTKTLTVQRAYAGTVASAIADASKVEVLFVEGDEGRDARTARYKPRKRVSNLTQIFDDSVELSGTAMAVNQFGIDNLYESEKQKKQLELALQLEKAIINGIRYESGTKRMMKGIRSFIESNVQNAAGAPIKDDMLTQAFKTIFEKGGMETGATYKIIVGAKQKTAISQFDKASIRLDRQDNGRGQVVDHYVSDFGSAEIVLNNNLAADEILIVDVNRIKIKPLNGREFAHTYLGVQGDYMRGMLVGEYTLEFFQEKAHARIKNLG